MYEKLRVKTSEPRLYSFVISPNLLQLKNDKGEFQLDPKIIPQSVCNVIAYDLDGAFKYISGVVEGKGLQAKHTNDEPLGDFLKLVESNFTDAKIALPTMITSPPEKVEPVKASAENWLAYLRGECKKVGYVLRKIKV